MGKSLLISVLILIFAREVFAQEKVDSLKISDTPPSLFINPFSVEHSLDMYFPLSDPAYVNEQMRVQLFEYNNEFASKYQYFVTPLNSFYVYSNNGYTFLQNSVPMFLGFSYHLNDALNWKRLDLFVDGSGILYNEYNLENPKLKPENVRGFVWEAGIGVGYKIAPKSTLFIKGSVQFNNMNPLGGRNVGGMNVKF